MLPKEPAITPLISGCACEGCVALRTEAGEHAPLYSRKLPIRGWAGQFSDAERLYMRAHPPEWYRQVLARPPQFGPKTPRTDAVVRADDSEVMPA